MRRHLPQVEGHELAADHARRGLLAHAEVGVEAGEVGVAEAVIFLREVGLIISNFSHFRVEIKLN